MLYFPVTYDGQELEKLQDEVGTFSDTTAMAIIQDELGRPAQEIFEFNPPSPIASASIGQVGPPMWLP